MLFWPLALIALVALLVVQLYGAFPSALRGGESTGELIYLSILLACVVLYGATARRIRFRQGMLAGLGWITAFVGMMTAYTFREEALWVFDRVRGDATPMIAVARGDGTAELQRASDGHFRAVTTINGEKVGVLVDTGASLVVLTWEDAEAAHIDMAALDFRMPVTTANGSSYVAPVTLDSVRIGEVELFDVRAAVAEQGKLHSSLLGMSYLGRISETSFRGETLHLTQ